MTNRLFSILSDSDEVEIFVPDFPRSYRLIESSPSWSEASRLLLSLASRLRPVTLVVSGTPPPDSFLRDLATLFDSYVFVPSSWLDLSSSRSPSIRATFAARLAVTFLTQPIQVDYFRDDSTDDDFDDTHLGVGPLDDMPPF